MAVIESKGDGYSLYNGVKLPSLPEITNEWLEENLGTPEYLGSTEWPEFKYSAIIDNEYVVLSARPITVDFYNNETGLFVEDIEEGIYDIFVFCLGEGTWDFYEYNYSIWYSFDTLLWSNHDLIYIPDNSIYLAASDPINLDGMNVIEWDGDATGLETLKLDPNYLLISSAADIDVNKSVISVKYNGDYYTVWNNDSLDNGGDYYWIKNAVVYVESPSDNFPTSGLYMHSVNNGNLYTSLFAYYPIEEEPEEPKNSTGKDFLLHQMFPKGIAFELTGKIYWMQ